MDEQFETLRAEIESAALDTQEAVEEFKIRYLSRRQGRVTELLKGIKDVPADQRGAYGQGVNMLKNLASERIEDALATLKRRASDAGHVDLTLPGRTPALGSIHPITETGRLITHIFESYGFTVEEGPEIEDDWHNFTALNFPPDHPARDMQDTFFIEPTDLDHGGVVLRTHTSPVQIRVMQRSAPPVRIIAPGRVFRNESLSYKSYCLFHQVEGLYVDEGVTMADLKQILHAFARAIFGDDVRMRFRPSYFPFTEPSAEVDIWWKDDALPEGGRWLEILGCGMVDPNVLQAVDIDPERYTGYAFGMGIDRIAMLRYGIEDIRLLFENDERFLEQFG
jgi:phenylalanyl-tRNA synthetase alpha chain